jgi:hypothetical protein
MQVSYLFLVGSASCTGLGAGTKVVSGAKVRHLFVKGIEVENAA